MVQLFFNCENNNAALCGVFVCAKNGCHCSALC